MTKLMLLKATTAMIAVTSVVAFSGSALAQTPPPAEPAAAPQDGDGSVSTVDEIIVTAQKRSEAVSDVPMSITAITGEDLMQRGVTGIQDLTKFTPGLSYVESGSSSPVYSLRGVGFFDTTLGARPAVSVYVDEVPLPFSIMGQGAAFDLQHVEILKGPQGTLFGQNSTGGAINYIAAKPGSITAAGVDISYSRFNTIDAQGYFSTPLTDTLGLRVAGRVQRGGDWQESYTRDDSLGSKDLMQGRVILEWDPVERANFTLNLNGFLDRSDTQAAQVIAFIPSTPRLASAVPGLATYPTAPADNRAADWDPNTALEKDNSFYQASLRGVVDLNDAVTLTSITAYSRFDVDQVTDQDGTSFNNVRTSAGGFSDSFSQELRLAGDAGPLRWVVGGNYAYDRAIENNRVDLAYSTTNAVTRPFGDLPATLQTFRQVFETKAVFGNLDWAISNVFTLHGGARYTEADLDYNGCARVATVEGGVAITGLYNALRAGRGLAPLSVLAVGECLMVDGGLNPGEARGVLNEDNVSWRLGLDWKPTDDLLVYANVSRGYKAGSAPTINGLAVAQIVPATQETVLAYEVGTKATLAGGAVDVAAAVFYYDYSDKQVRGRTLVEPALLGALETLVNVPESYIQGAEIQVNLRPITGLRATLAGTYLDSEVTSPFLNYSILGIQQDFEGNAFPYTPKWQLVADVQYEWPINASLGGFVGTNANYRSSTTAGFGDDALLDVDAYTLVDIRAGVESSDGRWRVQAFGRNIFDEYYWTNVAKFVDNVRRYSGTPATYGVQLTLKY